MDADYVDALFHPLFSEFEGEDEYPNKRPLLAHYTSLNVVESILKNDEIWFSNPLLMNDLEEVRFGYIHGARIAKESVDIKNALKTTQRHSLFVDSLDHYISEYETNDLMDTYVFCLSEHSLDDGDGLLSMWRGYGENGNGAALIIDTSKIEEVDESPIMISKSQIRFGRTPKAMDFR